MNLVIYSILFSSVVKAIDNMTCYSDILYRETNGSAIQVTSLWKIKLGLLQPSRGTAKYQGCQKSQGNSLLVNYAHDYLIM